MKIWVSIIMFILVTAPNLYSQRITLSGIVTDQHGRAVAGAMLLEQKSINTVSSDNKGRFEITVDSGAMVYVSHSDYAVTSFEGRNNSNEINIMLAGSESKVNIGYGSAEENTVTGAITSLDEDDLKNANPQDLGEAIGGQVAGISISTDYSEAGESSQIIIRGYSSMFADTTPLYVVDGVPQDGVPSLLPSEIKSVDVLKDAASCAVYGVRGASGVILITTK